MWVCCEGVFHTYAHLYTDEDLHITTISNIPIVYNDKIKDKTFSLPCPSFEGCCSIYTNKPSACSIYTCDLIESLTQNHITLDEALHKVSEIKSVLNKILPILKNHAINTNSNKPQYLIENILNHLDNDSQRDAFKKENRSLFMQCATFYFLEDKYFNKKSVLLGMS